jgi:hypothetical protein
MNQGANVSLGKNKKVGKKINLHNTNFDTTFLHPSEGSIRSKFLEI